jgi:hypothetical protein
MPKPRWYSPQLSRELVTLLYHQARAERIPMTKLANTIIEQALGNKKQTNTQRVVENRNITQSN